MAFVGCSEAVRPDEPGSPGEERSAGTLRVQADSISFTAINSLYDSAEAMVRTDADTLETIGLFVRAAEGYARLQPPRWDAVLNCYGAIASRTHRSELADTALYYAQRGDELLREHPEALRDFNGAVAFRNMALAFCDALQFDLARQYATRSLDNANRAGDPLGIAISRDVLADVYSRSGSYADAIDLERLNLALYQSILDTAQRSKNSYWRKLSDIHLTMGEAFKQLGERDSTISHQRNAWHYSALDDPNGRDAATGEVNLGIAHLIVLGNIDSAIHYLELAAEHMPAHDPTGQNALTQGLPWLGIAYAVSGRTEDARKLASTQLDSLFNYFSPAPDFDWNRTDIQVIQVVDAYACVYEELFKLTKDQADADMACRLSDDVIRGHVETHKDADPVSHIAGSGHRCMHMNRYISFLHACKGSTVPADKLTALFETKRSDQLRAHLQGIEEQGLGGHQVREYRRLTAERALLAERGHDQATVASIAQLDQQIDSVRNLLSSFSSSSPNVDGEVLLAQVRQAIDDSTIVLNYSWADDANGAYLQILALSKQKHWFSVLPARPLVDSLVGQKIEAVRTGRADVDDGSLLTALTPNGLDLLNYKALVVLPDGPLNALPFESLVINGEAKTPELLVDRHEVRYEYCLSFLRAREERQAAGDVLACAPSFTGTDTSWSALRKVGSLKQAAGSYLRSGPGPLTENIPEAEQAAALLHGRVLTGSEVTEEELRRALPGSGVLHFATHAVCSSRLPELSGILLAPVVATGGTRSTDSTLFERNDGVLHAYEIQSMDIPAELVVLSACETAVGKERLGEGAMSIARAFKYAGTKNMVSSLWKVDDRATKEIMVKFYEHLAEDMGKADALAQAKRWYRTEFPDEPPSKWAAFILIGDNEPVRLKKRSPERWWMIGAGIAVLVAAALTFRRLRLAA